MLFIFEAILVGFFRWIHIAFGHRCVLGLVLSRQALSREGDYEMMPVCACMYGCMCTCMPVLVSHADFPKTTYSYRFFVNIIVLMNFHALENFFGFMDLGLKISE